MTSPLRPIFALLLTILTSAVTGCGGGDSSSIDYAALGASDVTGVGAVPITNGYVYLIEDGIQQETNKGVALENLGIPGAQISAIQSVEVEILKRSGQPDVITLSTGANDLIAGDSIDGFERKLGELLSDLRSISPNAILAVSNLPDLTQLERFRERPDRDVTLARVQGYNRAIARQVSAARALLVDLYSVPLNDSLVSDVDGFHPSNAGHRAIANAFLAVINPYLVGLE
jgi:acyl-CoA thioesterase-1